MCTPAYTHLRHIIVVLLLYSSILPDKGHYNITPLSVSYIYRYAQSFLPPIPLPSRVRLLSIYTRFTILDNDNNNNNVKIKEVTGSWRGRPTAAVTREKIMASE